MIEQDIASIEKAMEEDATEKAYCDEELAKTEEKKVELDDNIAALTAKIDKASQQTDCLSQGKSCRGTGVFDGHRQEPSRAERQLQEGKG